MFGADVGSSISYIARWEGASRNNKGDQQLMFTFLFKCFFNMHDPNFMLTIFQIPKTKIF